MRHWWQLPVEDDAAEQVIWLANFWSLWGCAVLAGKMGIQSIAAVVLVAIVFSSLALNCFCRQWATSPICLAGRLGALRLYQLATGSFIWPFHLTSPLLTSRSAHHPFDIFHLTLSSYILSFLIWFFYHITSKPSFNDFISCYYVIISHPLLLLINDINYSFAK